MLKRFKIFAGPDGEMEAVKIGWSWPGFFFGYLWALVKRLYLLAGVAFVLVMALQVAGKVGVGSNAQVLSLVSGAASLGLSILFGIKGNDWRDWTLRRRRYRYRTVVSARTPSAAVSRYFEQALAQADGRG